MFNLNKISNFFILAFILILSSIANSTDNLYYHNNEILDYQVRFSSDPADDDNDGQITICGGTIVTFTDTSSNVPEDVEEYEWNFEGGDPVFSEDEGPHQVLFEFEGIYQVELEIDGFSYSMTVNVISDEIQPIVQPPGSWGESIFNGVRYLTSCNINQGALLFNTLSTGTDENSIHQLILSSNGTEIQTIEFTGENSNNLFFNIPNGISQIKYTIQQGECLYENNFNFFVGAPPSASIGNDGSTILCTSETVTLAMYNSY